MNRQDSAALVNALLAAKPSGTRSSKLQAIDYVQAVVAWENTARTVVQTFRARQPRLFPNSLLQTLEIE